VLLSRLAVFYLINLIVLGPLIAVQLFLPEVAAQLESGQVGPPQISPTQALVAAGAFLLAAFLSLILQPIGTAAILYIIAEDFVDRPATLGSALRFAFGRFLPLLGTSLLLGLVLLAGFLMLCFPVVIFAVWYAFAAQVVVVENRSGMDALSRSKDLLVPRYPAYYVNTLVAQLLSILVQTYQAVCVTLMYFDLRIRKEGFDLEMLAGQQEPPPPPLQAEIV
jgi:hypothetical protein